MSVIVKEIKTQKILILTKGADVTISGLLRQDQLKVLDTTMAFVNEFATEGLRTLLLAQKEIDPDYYA